MRQDNHRRQPNETQIGSKLGALFNRTRAKEGIIHDFNTNRVDGVDHINVNSNGKTQLGYLLSTRAQLNFNMYGITFSSIENLIAFYRSFCTRDDLPTATKDVYHDFMRTHIDEYPIFNNLYTVVCMGYEKLFQQYPDLTLALSDNFLPLDSYVIENGKPKRHSITNILLTAINEAHQAVVLNREPYLRNLMFKQDIATIQNQMQADGNQYTFNHYVRERYDPVGVAYDYARAIAIQQDEAAKRKAKPKHKKKVPGVGVTESMTITRGAGEAVPYEQAAGTCYVVDDASSCVSKDDHKPNVTDEVSQPDIKSFSNLDSFTEFTTTDDIPEDQVAELDPITLEQSSMVIDTSAPKDDPTEPVVLM